jgi:hypothetical protein
VPAVDVICALRAFETTLRAACRSGGVTLPGPLHSELVHAQETSKPLKAVSSSCSSRSVTHRLCPTHVCCLSAQVILSGSTQEGHVTALAACLASYAAAKSLILLGCNVGDTVRGSCKPAAVTKHMPQVLCSLCEVCCVAGAGCHRILAAGVWQQVVAWVQAPGAGNQQCQPAACLHRHNTPAAPPRQRTAGNGATCASLWRPAAAHGRAAFTAMYRQVCQEWSCNAVPANQATHNSNMLYLLSMQASVHHCRTTSSSRLALSTLRTT